MRDHRAWRTAEALAYHRDKRYHKSGVTDVLPPRSTPFLRRATRARPESPKTFIVYSRDSDTHNEWVKQLATRLTKDGVAVTFDQWDAEPGDQITEFMERAVRENDFV